MAVSHRKRVTRFFNTRSDAGKVVMVRSAEVADAIPEIVEVEPAKVDTS
jgi:hypothetical protein